MLRKKIYKEKTILKKFKIIKIARNTIRKIIILFLNYNNKQKYFIFSFILQKIL